MPKTPLINTLFFFAHSYIINENVQNEINREGMKKKLFTIFEILVWTVLFFVPVMFLSSLLHPDLAIKKHYTASFYDIDGVIVGSPVNFAGYNIGYVKSIKIDGNKVKLDLAITKDRVTLPRCTDAKIDAAGLGGSKSIELTVCPDPATEPGIYSTRPKKLNDVLADADKFSKALTEGMGNMYLGLNAGIGDKDHDDFVALNNNLKHTEADFYSMGNELTLAKTKAKKNLPIMNKKMEDTLAVVSEIDIQPEKIKADTQKNQIAIETLDKTIKKHTPTQYKNMAQDLYWRTEYLKLIDKKKVVCDLENINKILQSIQKTMCEIECNFSSESLQKRQKNMEKIKESSRQLIQKDF